MVAALIRTMSFSVSGRILSTPFCLSTATISGRNGANRLEQMQPRGLSVVTGEGHEFVQDQSFLFPTGAKIPRSPGFHKLGYTDLGHRFLLLSVTQFMRNR